MSRVLTPSGTDVAPDAATHAAFEQLVAAQPWLVEVGEVVAIAMHPWTMRALVAAGCVVAWRRGRRRTALVAGGTMLVGSLAGAGLKLLVRRDRPPFADDVGAELGFSMPSGHALGGVLGLGLMIVLAWPWLRERGLARPSVAVAAALGLVVCVDRLVLGVHYLSDVAVGAALGGTGTAIAVRLVRPDRLGDLTRSPA